MKRLFVNGFINEGCVLTLNKENKIMIVKIRSIRENLVISPSPSLTQESVSTVNGSHLALQARSHLVTRRDVENLRSLLADVAGMAR